MSPRNLVERIEDILICTTLQVRNIYCIQLTFLFHSPTSILPRSRK